VDHAHYHWDGLSACYRIPIHLPSKDDDVGAQGGGLNAEDVPVGDGVREETTPEDDPRVCCGRVDERIGVTAEVVPVHQGALDLLVLVPEELEVLKVGDARRQDRARGGVDRRVGRQRWRHRVHWLLR
jgi:hypothetical protein